MPTLMIFFFFDGAIQGATPPSTTPTVNSRRKGASRTHVIPS